jgi:hypothetical protein
MISGGMRFLWMALGLCVLLGALGFGASVAAAEDDEPNPKPPLYDGAGQFFKIQGPEDAEEYSWRVQLEPDQTLVQIDDQSAGVFYEGGQRALSIEVGGAHDASGATVPMTLAVSDTDVVTFTVHHRAGNPAAGGAPFDYPISPGVGWEGGFSTVTVIDEGIPRPLRPVTASHCIVPRLTFKSLDVAKARLENAGCRLGKVKGMRSKAARVVKQFRAPWTVHAAGARVAIKLG